MKQQEGMSLIVKTVTRVSVWLIILYGLYITFHGHLTPGGGFAGGVVIALAFLNVFLGFGKEFVSKWLNIGFLHDVEAASAILFVCVGILGIAVSGGFLANFLSKGELFRLFSSGTLPVLNILIGAKVGAGLFVVVWSLSLFHLDEGGDQ